ncbi:uncharacterized protein MELLADRAFT_60770 [Melampsora larici-populina 98AG31]|uniref:Uncharacterized protein n=1 Tax=Melampsora larici-populina (strain 98AG31 / pathotype 3-4-7) TaxID=747676 RepID=F4RC71_MELLP|nr:uncharacterized protein MELLADRAFT_60770 [Melampsora larici-populina 98AG31]EGG10001.1 hypothetical protein MELLADRAFT_60770 [Melampsora larici-populina 98AG31]
MCTFSSFQLIASHHWKKGAAVTSLKALNASVSDSLPDSTEALCQLLAGFTRHMLGFNELTKAYPPEPTPDELCRLRPLTRDDIMSDRAVFTSNPTHVIVRDSDAKLERFKALFLADLQKHGINQITFDWKSPDRDPWNRTMALFLVKHWQYAKSEGAFPKQSISSDDSTEKVCIGIVHRWMRGTATDIRQGRRSPQKLLRKETGRKKIALFKYRLRSMSALAKAEKLGDEATKLLPHHDCCSDTEWQPENTHHPAVGLIWRSQEFTSVLHQLDELSEKYSSSTKGPLITSRRFDQCRTVATTTNASAPVCRGLPENCYEPVWLSSLTAEEKVSLQIKPVSTLLNTLPVHIKKNLV